MRWTLLILSSLAALIINAEAELLDVEATISRMSEAQPVKYFVNIKRENQQVCRGGIIGTWIILTAANCVYDKSTKDFIPGSLSIVAGSGNGTVVVDVEKIYVPKVYADEGNTVAGDIAVLKLKQNLDLRKNRKTIQRLTTPRRLRDSSYKNYLNEPVKVSNFDEDDTIKLPYLLKAKVIDAEECVERNDRPVQETELCAKIDDDSYAPTKLCKDDIGGPLVFNKRVVIGVALVPANRCILNGEPAVYTRVSSFLPFIKAARYGDKDPNALVKVL